MSMNRKQRRRAGMSAAVAVQAFVPARTARNRRALLRGTALAGVVGGLMTFSPVVNDAKAQYVDPNPAATTYVNNGAEGTAVSGNAGTIINSTTGVWTANVNAGANTGTGYIINQGTWVGTGNNDGGQLTNQGTWTGDVVNTSGAFSNTGGASASVSGSLTNAGTAANAGALNGGVVNNAGTFVNQNLGTVTGGVTNKGGQSVNQSGGAIDWVSVDAGRFANDGQVQTTVSVAGGALFDNHATGVVAGWVTNSGTSTNAGQINGGLLNQAGVFTNLGLPGPVGVLQTANVAGGTLNNAGKITAGVNVQGAGTFNNLVGGSVGTDVSNAGSTSNAGTISGVVVNTGTFVNLSGGTTGAVTNSGSGVFDNQSGATIASALVAGGTLNNAGTITAGVNVQAAGAFNNLAGGLVGADIYNAGASTNAGLLTVAIYNSGSFVNLTGATTGAVFNSAGLFVNQASATIASAQVDGGTVNNAGLVTGAVTIASAGTFNNLAGSQVNGAVTNSGTATNAGTMAGGVTNNAGVFANLTGGLVGPLGLTNNGGMSINQTGATLASAQVNGGTLTNAGSVTGAVGVASAGTFNNLAGSQVNGAVTNSGTTTNAGTMAGGVTNNAGVFANLTGGLVGPLGLTNNGGVSINQTGATLASAQVNGGTLTNAGSVTGAVGVTSAGTFNNLAPAVVGGLVTSAGTTFNSGVFNAGLLTSGGVTTNVGTVNGGATVTGGTLATSGTINGGLTNSATVNASGAINGAILNNAPGVFNVVAALTGNDAFTNAAGAKLNVGAAYNGATNLTNAGAVNVLSSGALNLSGALTNSGVFASAGAVSSATLSNSGTLTSLGSLKTTGLASNSGQMVLGGSFSNGSLSNSGTITVLGALGGASGATANSGTINVNTTGASMTMGALNNTGLLNMIGGGATNVVNAGPYSGAGGVIGMDTSLAGGASDRLNLGGASSGSGTVKLNFLDVSAPHADTVLITNGAGATFVSSVSLATSNPSPFAIAGAQLVKDDGFLQQWFGQSSPGVWALRSDVNVAQFSSIMGSVSGMMSAITTAFSEPASAFISKPQDDSPNKFSIGAWGRNRDGKFDIKSSTSVSGGVAGTDRIIGLTSKTQFAGFQLGVDAGLYNIQNSGWSANLGVHGGYIDGESRTPQATLKVQDPFYGVYGALTNGPFALDVLVRKDHYDLNLSPTDRRVLATGTDGKFKGDGWSGLVNAQYRFSLTDRWFLEPSATFMYSRITLDDFRTIVGPVKWGTLESKTGRLGLTLRTVYQAGDFYLSPSVQASVWHEFAGRSKASLFFTTGGGLAPVVANTNRLGTYGQVSAALTAIPVNLQNFTGFVRGDWRFGSKINGWAVNAGMRYQF